MTNFVPILTPIACKIASNDTLVDATYYCSLLGALQHLTFSRSDIQFVVNRVC